jgi:hypothetical protein
MTGPPPCTCLDSCLAHVLNHHTAPATNEMPVQKGSRPGEAPSAVLGIWWLPRWLDRILPNIDVEGHAEASPDDQSDPERELAGV